MCVWRDALKLKIRKQKLSVSRNAWNAPRVGMYARKGQSISRGQWEERGTEAIGDKMLMKMVIILKKFQYTNFKLI